MSILMSTGVLVGRCYHMPHVRFPRPAPLSHFLLLCAPRSPLSHRLHHAPCPPHICASPPRPPPTKHHNCSTRFAYHPSVLCLYILLPPYSHSYRLTPPVTLPDPHFVFTYSRIIGLCDPSLASFASHPTPFPRPPAQNGFREMHQVTPLEWNDETADKAKAWCNVLTAERKGAMAHPHGPAETAAHLVLKDGKKLGQNIAFLMFTVRDPVAFDKGEGQQYADTVKKMAKMWHDEVNVYDFAKPTFTGATGHFTQLVWKATTFVGCGITRTGRIVLGCCDYGGKEAMPCTASYFTSHQTSSSVSICIPNTLQTPVHTSPPQVYLQSILPHGGRRPTRINERALLQVRVAQLLPAPHTFYSHPSSTLSPGLPLHNIPSPHFHVGCALLTRSVRSSGKFPQRPLVVQGERPPRDWQGDGGRAKDARGHSE